MIGEIQTVGGYKPPKPGKPENIFEATARRNKEKAARDAAFAERLEIAQSSNTEVLIEGGGIPEDKGRTMPWNK